jgi:hypothetical protein
MYRSDDLRKLAILERLEHTRFLECSSGDSFLLDFAMQHSKADLVIPKDPPTVKKEVSLNCRDGQMGNDGHHME